MHSNHQPLVIHIRVYRPLSSFPYLKLDTLIQCWLIVTTLGILNLHCSWTPDVETTLHDSSHGTVSLKTSHALKITPDHPHFLPKSLIKHILAGINRKQEGGMLQHILLPTVSTVPAFSPSQIDFLSPQLSMALSKATPEETIHFKAPATMEEGSSVQGIIAAFSPTYLLLVLNHANEFSGMSSKIYNSSRARQITSSLTYVKEVALLRGEKVQTFMEIPSTSHGIIINYQPLMPTDSHHQNEPSDIFDHQITGDEKGESRMKLDSLKDQLRDLQERIDEQSEEIRRLKQFAPP